MYEYFMSQPIVDHVCMTLINARFSPHWMNLENVTSRIRSKMNSAILEFCCS